MKKRILSLLLSMSMVLALAGCGKEVQPSEDTSNEQVEEQTEEQVEEEVEAQPEKIVSMVFGTDEMVLGLTDVEKIVGLSGKDNGIPYMADPDNAAADVPRVNDNPEILVAMEPDFVVGSSWVSEELKAVIADMDVPFYGYTTPKTMEELTKIVEDIGYLLGEDEKTAEVVGDIEARIQAVSDKVANISDEDKVRVMAYNMHGSSNALGTIFDDMATIAGTTNISSEAGLEGNGEISKEQIVDMNPEVIILVKWASDTSEDFDAFVDELLNDPSLSTVDAIKNERVYVSLDNSITNISQFAIDGLEFVAKSCYPDLF